MYFKLCKSIGAEILGRKDELTYIEHPTEKRLMKIDEFEKRYPNEANVIDLAIEHFKKGGHDMTPYDFWNFKGLDEKFKFWGSEVMGTEYGANWRDISTRQIGDM